MEGVFRRSSGVYIARLAVPARLRQIAGKIEFIQSTGVRDLALARIVGGQLILSWRQRLLELEQMMLGGDIDVLLAQLGSPVTATAGHVTLAEAAAATGIGQHSLLREVAGGRLQLYWRSAGIPGNCLPLDLLQRFQPEGRGSANLVMPSPQQMPPEALAETFVGVLAVSESKAVGHALLTGESWVAVVFAMIGRGKTAFVPDVPVTLVRERVLVSTEQAERVRVRVANLITPAQVQAATVARLPQAPSEHANRGRALRESIEDFLSDNKNPRAADQTARVRGACSLFLDLMGVDLRGKDLSRELLRRYRDDVLPRVPSNENKIRLQFGTTSVPESMAAVAGSAWTPMSVSEQVKRFKWCAEWIEWLGQERWCEGELVAGLVGRGEAAQAAAKQRKAVSDQDRRDPFTDADLQKIFSASWFKDGAGELTKKDTYRTWSPCKTWLPLMSLYSGARLNELAQLELSDIRRNASGMWIIDINDLPDDRNRPTKAVIDSRSVQMSTRGRSRPNPTRQV